MRLLQHTKIIEHTIELEEDEQPSYRLIYSPDLMKLKTLKTYIKTYLNARFIWLLKFLAGAFFLFNQK